MGIIIALGLIGGIGLLILLTLADKKTDDANENNGCISKLAILFFALLFLGFITMNIQECSSMHEYEEPAHFFRP